MTNYNMRTFYILAVTQVFSMVGSAMTSFAIGVWVYTETGNATPIVLTAFFTWLPPVMLNSFAGVLADRFSRKKLIILRDAAHAMPTLLLALAFLTKRFELWQLYTAAFVQSLFGLVQGPSISASVTMLVPDSQRNRAKAILAVAGSAAGLLAPLVGGALYAIIDVAGVIFVDLATFVTAVLVITFIHIPQPQQTAESAAARGSVWQEMRGGLQFLLDRRGILYLSLYFTFLNFITNGVFVLRTPYILSLVEDEKLLGLLLTIASVGLVGGGLITIFWQGTKQRIHTILPSLALGAVLLILFGMVRTPLALGIVGFLMMLPYKMSNALLSTVMQAKVPPDMQGRVFSFTSQLSLFAMPLTYLFTGPLVDNYLEPAVGGANWHWVAPIVGNMPGSGMGLYIVICGAIWLVGTLVVYALPVVRNMEVDLPNYRAVVMETAVEPQPAA
jgi:MFS family permease